MISSKEFVEFVLKHRTNSDGNVDLSDLDFGDRKVSVAHLKGKEINNSNQRAMKINNRKQEAYDINNGMQTAKHKIVNQKQEALTVCNDQQLADKISFKTSKSNEIYIENIKCKTMIFDVKKANIVTIKLPKKVKKVITGSIF